MHTGGGQRACGLVGLPVWWQPPLRTGLSQQLLHVCNVSLSRCGVLLDYFLFSLSGSAALSAEREEVNSQQWEEAEDKNLTQSG